MRENPSNPESECVGRGWAGVRLRAFALRFTKPATKAEWDSVPSPRELQLRRRPVRRREIDDESWEMAKSPLARDADTWMRCDRDDRQRRRLHVGAPPVRLRVYNTKDSSKDSRKGQLFLLSHVVPDGPKANAKGLMRILVRQQAISRRWRAVVVVVYPDVGGIFHARLDR